MLEASLVDRQVAVIVAADPAPETIKASKGIPVVFVTGGDPLKSGFLANLEQPDGDATGITYLTNALGGKQMELLRAIVPKAKLIALVASAATDMAPYRDALAAAGQPPLLLAATTPADLDQAFATAYDRHDDSVLIASDPFVSAQRDQLVALAARYRLPTMYPLRDFVEAGGLVSYGANVMDAYRQAGVYVGRILKGAAPGDLPVLQPTKFELIANLKTASALGLTLPPSFLASADAVL